MATVGSRRIWAGAAVIALAAFAAVQASRRSPPEATPPAADTGPTQDVAADERIPIIDVHVHVRSDAMERLQGLMDRYGFDHAINLSGGHPLRELPAQMDAAKTAGRITNFTGLAYEQATEPGYGERMARVLRIAHEQGARGLKIAKALGLGLRDPNGRLIPVDDPELDIVFETAGELDMPVAIHAGDPKAFWEPIDANNERLAELTAHPGWSQHGREVPSFDAILDQLDRRVARHPKTTFISVHFGNCAEDLERVARTLRKYDNLYIDTAARVPEIGRHPVAKLQAFFAEFQDRILYGSDLGIGPEPHPLFLGSSGSEPPTDAERERFFEASRRFFETSDRDFAHPTPIQGDWRISGIGLPRPILEKVYWKNAARLLKIAL